MAGISALLLIACCGAGSIEMFGGDSEADTIPVRPVITRTTAVTTPPIFTTPPTTEPAATPEETEEEEPADSDGDGLTDDIDDEPETPLGEGEDEEEAESEEESESQSVYYDNCTDARNAGAAPISRGEPGYRAGLDRNKDGVACE